MPLSQEEVQKLKLEIDAKHAETRNLNAKTLHLVVKCLNMAMIEKHSPRQQLVRNV